MKRARLIITASLFCLFFQFASSVFAQDPLFPIKQGDKWGYINASGQIVVQPAFGEAKPFSNGMGAVREWSPSIWLGGSRKWGFVNSSGALAIKPQFIWVEDFSEDVALVTGGESSDSFYIDKSGNSVIAHQNGVVFFGPFSSGLARVKTSRGYAYMNKQGTIAFEAPYKDAYGFNNGFAYVSNGDSGPGYFAPDHRERGFIDTTGKLLFPLKKGSYFSYKVSEGLISFTCIGLFCSDAGFMDTTGKVVIKLSDGWRPATEFSQGLAGIRKGIDDTFRYAFINTKGDIVFRVAGAQSGDPYSTFKAFSEGLAAVKVGGKFGFIDTGGVMRIGAQFDQAESFSGGLAKVTVGGSLGYIDKTGRFVWKSA